MANKILKEIGPIVDKIAKEIATKFFEKMDLAALTSAARQAALQVAAKSVEAVLSEHSAKSAKPEGYRSKGLRSRILRTMVGNVTYQREAFYDQKSKKLMFPADDELGIIHGNIQSDIKDNLVFLAIDMPFSEAEKKFEKLTGLSISEGIIHDTTVKLGKIATLDNVLPDEKKIDGIIDALIAKCPTETVHLVLGVDGAHEPLRDENAKRKGKRGEGFWKECKGFRLYAIVGNHIEQIASWHQISDDKELEAALNKLSSRIKHRTETLVTVADGAKWIWKCFDRVFPRAVQVLDWYHCVENLAKYTTLRYGAGAEDSKVWLDSASKKLMLNHASDIIDELLLIEEVQPAVNSEAKRLAEYLLNNLHRIQYESYRKIGLTIGSGGMESANRFLCHTRLKRSGCWWKQSHADELLRLRCAKTNGTLEQIEQQQWRKTCVNKP